MSPPGTRTVEPIVAVCSQVVSSGRGSCGGARLVAWPSGGGDMTGRRVGQEQLDDLVVESRDTRIAIEASLLPPLFDARGVAIVATDVRGRVTALSPLAEELLGFSESELTGSLFHDRVHSRRPDGTLLPADECPIVAAIRGARSAAGEGEVLARKDGTIVHTDWAVAPIVIAAARTGAIIALSDVERRAQSGGRLRLDSVGVANVRLALLADASHSLLSAASLRAGLA